MPFGKHRGTPIRDVPESYLRWVLANVETIEPGLKAKIEGRLNIQPATLPLAVEEPESEPEPDPASPQGRSALAAARLEIEKLKLEVKRLNVAALGFESDLKRARRDGLDDKLRLKNKDVEISRLKSALGSQPRRFGAAGGPSEFRRVVKQWYGAVSRKFHPDMGGSAANQTVVNVCYRDLIERLEQMEKSK